MKMLTKKIFVLFFCLFFLFSPVCAKKAEAAWIPVIDPIFKQALEVFYRTRDKIMGGVMKQTTAISLFNNMTGFIGGSSSGGSLITKDWGKALIEDPNKKADEFIDDYISKAIGGRGGSGYEGFGGGGDFFDRMAEGAKAITSEKKDLKADYEGDPTEMFSSGQGIDDFMSFYSGVNNPISFRMDVEQKYEEKKAEEQKLAEIPRVAYQGFEPKGGYSDVSIPGSLLKENLADIQDIGNKVMAGSEGISETLITTILNQIIQQMIMQGL